MVLGLMQEPMAAALPTEHADDVRKSVYGSVGEFVYGIRAYYREAEYTDIAVSAYSRTLLYESGNAVVAAANENHLYGLVDLYGGVISDFQYAGMWALGGGLFKFSNSTDGSSGQGIMDSKGEILLPMGNYQIEGYSNVQGYSNVISVYNIDIGKTEVYPVEHGTIQLSNDLSDVAGWEDVLSASTVSYAAPDTGVGEDTTVPSDTTTSEPPSGDTTSDDTTSDEPPSDEPPSDEPPSGDTPSGDTPSGDTPSGDTTPDSPSTSETTPVEDSATPDANALADLGIMPLAAGWESSYDEVEYLDEQGVYRVTKNGLWGIVGANGTELVSPSNSGQFEVSSPNPDNYSVVTSLGSDPSATVSYLLKDGTVTNTFTGRLVRTGGSCRNFAFLDVSISNGYGLMDAAGNTILEPHFFSIYGYGHYWKTRTRDSDGNDLYGLYSENGECILKDVYSDIYDIDVDRYVVGRDGKFGLMAISGNTVSEVIPIAYDNYSCEYPVDHNTLMLYPFIIFTKGNVETVFTLDGDVLMESNGPIEVFASELFRDCSHTDVGSAYMALTDGWAKKCDGYTGSVLPFVVQTNDTASGYATYYMDCRHEPKTMGYIPYRASNINEDGYFVYQDVNGLYGIGSTKDDLSAALPSGVKYVPYSWKPAHPVSGSKVVAGVLPQGLDVDPETGEIHGVPLYAGKWDFVIASSEEETPWTITIKDNSDDNVQAPNHYPIEIPVGTEDPHNPNHFYKYDYRQEILKIKGPITEFVRLLIDGRELARDLEYEAHEGSTVITIYGETFEKTGPGTHTIAAEFREGGTEDGTLKTVSQNYTIELPYYPSVPTRPSGNTGSGSKKEDPKPAKPAEPAEPAEPAPEPTPVMPFTDVPVDIWFYDDVKWNYENSIMTGVTETLFAPEDDISQATIVTVMARLAEVDLTKYESVTDDTIQPGQWYTTAAVWAQQSGLLPDYSVFTGEEKLPREQMAIMLVKYMNSMGIEVIPPANAATFADSDLMSEAGNAAFQTLYNYGIFKGIGNNTMDPGGLTSRAQFAALIHRISVFVEAR